MATNHKNTVTEAQIEPKTAGIGSTPAAKPQNAEDRTKTEPTAQESTYTVDELARAHKSLGTSYEIVKVALKQAGKDRATIAEAKDIIETFKKREVK